MQNPATPPLHHSAPRRIEVSAGLVFHDGRLLITQRKPDAHLGGLWEFPGGKREPGETFEQCLRRELQEELGIDVLVGTLIEEISHDYPDKQLLLRFYRCTLERGEPRPIGCHAVAWVTRATLNGYEFPAADKKLLRTLQTAAW
jgi:8-oxo-dGTP diphosphatase